MNAFDGNNSSVREFEFTQDDFERVRTLLFNQAGISLSDIKHDMVYNRLVKRLRHHGLSTVKEYLDLLDDSNFQRAELTNFINALTTNLTSFFRESHHFDFLAKLVPELLKTKNKIRIWSSACSVGEEPYSIAMCIYPFLTSTSQVEIIATDIDTNVLATAKAGIYDVERINKLPNNVIKAHFLKGKGSNQGMVRVKPHLQEMIRFSSFNLIKPWPARDNFDIIFCRNVMIYFDKQTQQDLIKKMANNMTDQGHLFIGHSETLQKISDQFHLVGQTIYQKGAEG